MKAFPTTDIYQCVYLVGVFALPVVQGYSPGNFSKPKAFCRSESVAP